jgi:hypothetical protein
MAWREELHPRDAKGRFAHKSAIPAVSIRRTLDNPAAASSDELLDVFHRMSSTKKIDAKSLAIIDAELARREGTADLPPAVDTPEQKALDGYLARGWSYAEAYGEAYKRSAVRVERQQQQDLIDRRTGETWEQARRRAYREVVWLEYMQAEEATRGNVIRQECFSRGVDPKTLWTASPARARVCATPELAEWWETQGGRTTYAAWKARLGVGGSRGRTAARAQAGAGAGRDYGL